MKIFFNDACGRRRKEESENLRFEKKKAINMGNRQKAIEKIKKKELDDCGLRIADCGMRIADCGMGIME